MAPRCIKLRDGVRKDFDLGRLEQWMGNHKLTDTTESLLEKEAINELHWREGISPHSQVFRIIEHSHVHVLESIIGQLVAPYVAENGNCSSSCRWRGLFKSCRSLEPGMTSMNCEYLNSLGPQRYLLLDSSLVRKREPSSTNGPNKQQSKSALHQRGSAS